VKLAKYAAFCILVLAASVFFRRPSDVPDNTTTIVHDAKSGVAANSVGKTLGTGPVENDENEAEDDIEAEDDNEDEDESE
jgi:hypothetical protein